jgi:hypothetical protein
MASVFVRTNIYLILLTDINVQYYTHMVKITVIYPVMIESFTILLVFTSFVIA